MKKIMLAAAVIAATTLGVAQAAGNATAGKSAAQDNGCMGCHGADGNSFAKQFPKLASQHPNYIAKQLADFKSGKRTDQMMDGVAKKLSKTDMVNIAAYFSKQPIKPGIGDENYVAAGEKIYRSGNSATGVPACMSCHGPSGKGNPGSNFPALASQHPQYLKKTLSEFKSGARSNDAGKMMRNIASRMSDEEINAVAHYIGSMH
jgi:cytochrome c553